MKLNDIKFVPATNAFGDVYAKATGIPFVGEMMAAAAGQGGDEPTPIKSLELTGMDYFSNDGSEFMIDSIAVMDEEFMAQYCGDGGFEIEYTIKDSNGNPIPHLTNGNIWGYSPYDCSTNIAGGYVTDSGTIEDYDYMFDISEGGIYDAIITKGGQEIIYEGSGTWTYRPLFYVKSVKVTKTGEDEFTIEAESSRPAPVANVYMYLQDGENSAFDGSVVPTEEGSTHWVMDMNREYSFNEESLGEGSGLCTVWGSFIDEPEHTIYCTWTYEAPQI